jgi:hypothetical protein
VWRIRLKLGLQPTIHGDLEGEATQDCDDRLIGHVAVPRLDCCAST